MTVGIDCKECGSDVVFVIGAQKETHPTASCDECGAVYRLSVSRIK